MFPGVSDINCLERGRATTRGNGVLSCGGRAFARTDKSNYSKTRVFASRGRVNQVAKGCRWTPIGSMVQPDTKRCRVKDRNIPLFSTVHNSATAGGCGKERRKWPGGGKVFGPNWRQPAVRGPGLEGGWEKSS